jgi:cation diffusion facilitator family transporter
MLFVKLAVGLATGSIGILGDAVHSVTDIANNIVAWVVLRLSKQPPDERHPYGHRKFETMAVFGLAMLLTVLAFELALRAIQREAPEVIHKGWAMGLMFGVLTVNVGLASWQASRARQLDSDLLLADARHTFADVLTTLVVIAGWQAAARGYPWVDKVAALGVSVVILVLAFGLFRRAIPILVDESAIDPTVLMEATLSVSGVLGVRSARSRGGRAHASVDVVAVVAPHLNTVESHAIATAVEHAIRVAFPVESILVHIEPAVIPVRSKEEP